jgi:hypothetical protein
LSQPWKTKTDFFVRNWRIRHLNSRACLLIAISTGACIPEILKRSAHHVDFTGRASEQGLGCAAAKGGRIMRKLMIVLVAIATIGAGATLPAFARGGGGHGGGGHGGHGGRGHSMSHAGIGHAAGIGRAGFARASLANPGMGRVGAARPLGWHGHRFAAGHKFAFRHHRFHRRFAFIGASFGYGLYDDCITRVWTPWGWRWTNVCY